jgi:hypothetical protein
VKKNASKKRRYRVKDKKTNHSSLSLSLSLSLREIPLLSVFHSTHQPTTDRNALSLLFFLEIIFIFISIVIFLF